MATTTLTPNATEQVGGWTDEGGGTTDLHLNIDELSADTVYIRTATDGAPAAGGEGIFSLTSVPGDFTTATAATLNIRHSRGGVEGGDAGGGDDTHTLRCSINHASLGNFVNTFVVETGTVGYTVKTENIGMSLTAAGLAATASDWNDARLIIWDDFSQSMGNDGDRVWVDFANITLTYTPAADFEIVGWRFRNDDGSETTATWKEPTNFPIHNVSLDTTMRIRFRLKEMGSAGVTNGTFQLQYQELAAGVWTNVTTTSNTVRAVASANVTDAGATTEQLTGGSGTFDAGEISEDGLVDTLTVAADRITEVEYVIQYRSADIALSDNGVALRITVNSVGTAYTSGTRECVIQIGGDLWWTEATAVSGRYAGPHVTSGGDLYVVGMTHHNIQNVDPRPEEQEWFIWKSTDDGSTWHIVGFVPMTCSLDDGRSIGVTDAIIVDDILYFSFHEQGNSVAQEVYLWAWDCVNDNIEFAEELVIGSLTTANCLAERCSIGIGVRSDGTVVMTQGYNNSGGSQEVNVFRRTGVATYASTSISTIAGTNAGGYMHTDDNFHIVYLDGNATALDVTHIVYKSDNTLSSTDVIASTGGAQITLPIKVRVVKAFNKLFTTQIESGALIRVWYSDGIGEDLGWTSVDLTNDTLGSAGTLSRTYMLDAFGGRVVVTWVEDSDRELFYQQWNNGSQNFDTEVGTTDVDTLNPYDFNMFTSSANDVKLGVASPGTGKVINLRFFSAGAPVDEDPPPGGATFSGWWGFIQGW